MHMKVHDEKLLILYKYLQINEYSRDEVAHELKITPRQLTRLIKQWQQEGLIEYIGGVGRGNNSKINFKVDVEQQFIMNVLSQLEHYSIEEITNILLLPLNESSKNLIKGLFNTAVNIEEEIVPEEEIIGQGITVDYIYRFPKSMDPLQPMDTALDTLVYNTMDRLYEVDGDLNFKSHLVQLETFEDNSITLYLFQDITFSNGKQLLAHDIKFSLDRLLAHEWYGQFLSYIKSVEVIDLFVLKITFDGHIDKLKFDLSSPFASIYMLEGENYLGTHVYYVDRVTDDYIVMLARYTKHHNVPEVKKVYLVNSYSSYEQFIQDKHNESLLHNVKMTKFTLFNPYFTKLQPTIRKQLLYYIKKFHQGGYDATIEALEIPQNTMIMGIFELTAHLVMPVLEYLVALGFNIKRMELSYKDTLTPGNLNLACDFIILGHTYIDQVYYYSLMNNTNVKTWFYYFEESRQFIHNITHLPLSKWSEEERWYKSFLMDEGWYAEHTTQHRQIIALKGQKNVVFNNDGVISFGEIIVQ